MKHFFPLPRLVGIKLLFLDEVEIGQNVESVDFDLVWKKDFSAAVTLFLLQKDRPSQEELKVLKDLKVFLWMVLD